MPAFLGTLQASGGLVLDVLAPAQITASQNDYNPTGLAGAGTLRLGLSADWTITGLAGGAAGRVIVIQNASTFNLTLTNTDAASAAANRFAHPGGITQVLVQGQSVTMAYDSASSIWRVMTVGQGQTAVASTSAIGDAATAGTNNGFFSRGSHVHGRESFATNTLTLATAATAGSATTPMRSDGAIAAFDATVPANATPSNQSAAGSAAFAARRDHLHWSPGAVATLSAATAGINTTETQIVGFTVPASTLTAGSTFKITAYALVTATVANLGTLRCRWGTTTLTGNIPVVITPTSTASSVGAPFRLEMVITVRTNGASGTVTGNGAISSTNATAGTTAWSNVNNLSAITATVVLDTTANKIIELTCVTAATTTTVTFYEACIEWIRL